MSGHGTTEHLFSYGTLQLEAVQLAVFGRKLEGRADCLKGYMTVWRRIGDPEVEQRSGKKFYPALSPSSLPSDTVAGTVFEVTPGDLERADAHEVTGHARVCVVLASGTRAWVYEHIAPTP